MKHAQEATKTSDVSVELSPTEMTAVKAWQEANGAASRSEAIRELVKIGLMTEIRKIFEASANTNYDEPRNCDCQEQR